LELHGWLVVLKLSFVVVDCQPHIPLLHDDHFGEALVLRRRLKFPVQC
jgi:hypothetical protein